MNAPPLPPADILQQFTRLALSLRTASRARNYTTLGRLLGEHLDDQMTDVMVYIRTNLGTLTIVGAHTDLWLAETGPMALSGEPSLEDMGSFLYEARRPKR